MKKFLRSLFMFVVFSLIQSCGIDEKSSYESTEKCNTILPDGSRCDRNAEHGSLYCWKHNVGT